MRFIEPEIQKKGFVAVTLLIDPGKRFVDHDLAGITFHLSHAFAIAQEVGRVLVTAPRAVDDAEPIVKAVIGGSGIVAILHGHAEVPLAKVSGGIAIFLKHLGDRLFALQKMHPVKAFVEDRVDSSAMVVAPRQKSSPRRGTGWGARVEVGETHAPSSQLVENWCLDGTVVAADVAVAKIVDVERDDIGTLLSSDLSNQSRSDEKL